ncbi:cobyrinic acid a,c-diamide synthase/threonine-phosphate decarboxylase [Mobilicoccus pelagius NBRC 104925]|uniref:Cobyrinic acid a,c-diamide synthase/threonine-phosphate decarboxylase n=1 Tax=Mobilicoccus pelagius NBRC 104925 TaxID=1089455 RepID=H5UUV6_9MICO|nr:cobyrinic acid a,c-diamide synthase/threonine-phosphate decarboxylase [Mobilicoccus pelagius NBRC 104925]
MTPATGVTATENEAQAVDAAHMGLHHHGDVEARGMRDYAVNVAVATPPAFLRDALASALDGLAAYPDPAPATARLAAHLGVPEERVLLTNGAAEAFHLVARLRPWRRPVVVHPQFTEPEAALRTAGLVPYRHILPAPGFALDADTLDAGPDAEADLVVLGNPTNPTSRLHPVAEILRLRRPGRLVVVDEAFLDVVPREQDTALRHAASGEGLLVVRSLTKTFGLAGVRAGFLVAEPEIVAACAALQPHWSVNSLALAAVEAICSADGVAHTADVTARLSADRPHLVEGLTALGLEVCGPAAAPFVLARHPRAAELRTRLRERGIAVRRGDTFPGLDGEYVRIAVRGPQETDVLLAALADLLGGGTDDAQDDALPGAQDDHRGDPQHDPAGGTAGTPGDATPPPGTTTPGDDREDR